MFHYEIILHETFKAKNIGFSAWNTLGEVKIWNLTPKRDDEREV